MKTYKIITTALLLATTLATPAHLLAADAKKPKPYPLDKCVVSDEKLGADPSMTPYVFVQDGQEVKLCCKSCLKDFKKDQTKYMALISEAQKKAK